jgi:hypothetical protein
MKEKELKLILDRKKNITEANQIFSKQIDTLIDMVNFGSNLIVRAYDSSKKGLEDAIVIGVLLKQVVSMVDTVEVLASQGIVKPAYLQVRSAFEASLYIDWILKSESKKKAEYYYVSNLRNIKLWTLRYLEGTKENLDFSQLMVDLKDNLEPQFLTKKQEEEAKKQVTEIDRILSQDGFRQINEEFESKRGKKTSTEVYWYKPLQIDSIKKLAEVVGRLPEYVLYYSVGSELAHTTSYREHVKFNKGRITFEPVRHLEDMNSLLQAAMGVCLSSYSSIIKHYRFDERKYFSTKYKTDWIDAFQNIPSVSYKVEIQ